MRAFHFYIDDWLSSKNVRRMDAHEERGYLRLLLYAASEPDCGLPVDENELADISLLGEQWFQPTKEPMKRFRNETSGSKLLACFHQENGRYFNARLLKEFNYKKEIDRKRSEASAKGVAVRKQNHLVDHVDNQVVDHSVDHVVDPHTTKRLTNDVCVSVPVPVLSSSSEKSARETLLRQIWDAYPEEGRTDFEGARKAWDDCVDAHRFIELNALFAEVMAGLIRWRASDKWQRKVIHSIANWLRKGVWKEHPPRARGQPTKSRAEELNRKGVERAIREASERNAARGAQLHSG